MLKRCVAMVKDLVYPCGGEGFKFLYLHLS
jgi:hypothetical protein